MYKVCKYLSSLTVCVIVFAALAMLCSCNARKKNTAAARHYTAFITKYNIYYNGDRHYTETLHDMEKGYEDDYTSMLFMHPAEARTNEKAPQPSGDFNRSIEKAQKAIQLRSITKKPPRKAGHNSDPKYKAWMKRDEYNPFLHNAWLMMGRSQYMNGDFLGASATFFYTSKHFSWLEATVTEAQLWQARSYLALNWLFEAETILNRLKPEQLTSKELNFLYNFDMADLRLREKDYGQAVPYLEQAVKLSSGAQKTRLWFLLGQTFQRLDRKADAYKAFKKAGGASNASYRTKLNARIKQSEVYDGADIQPEVKALRRMTRYDRNKEYLDQIYYAIGNLYLSRGDTVGAIENYKLAVEKSTRSGIEKAIAQITLGALYYDRRLYELAQPCYAEAVPQLPADYPNLAVLKRRSDVLDELAVYSQNVNLQDSLLRLADMPENEQRLIINDIIEALKKKEKEEAEAARREAYLADQAAQGSQVQSQTQQFTLNTDNSWYFYNTATRNAGKTEFQRRWGARKLEDNWRRRNKSSFSLDDFGGGDPSSGDDEDTDDLAVNDTTDTGQTPEETEAAKRAEDPHYPEFYLKQIPKTPAERQVANDVIMEGLYNMGVILKDKLDDAPAALKEFDRLLTDYPDNIYRLDTYYNIYLIFMRQGNTSLADRYRMMIVSEFPDSKYGQALRNPDYIDNLRRMDAQQEALYEKAYEAYLANDNAAVHSAYEDMAERFPMSKLMPKFMFLHALAYATERRPDDFNAVLRQMLERYPDTDVAPIASAWLKGMAEGRQLRAGDSGRNVRGMIWNISLSNDTTAGGDTNGPQFELNEKDPQLLVFVYPTDVVSTNALLFEIARHNFSSFVVKDFDIEPMNFGRLGMIVVKPFEDINEVNHYRRVMANSDSFKLPAGVRPLAISSRNFEELIRSGASLDDYFRYLDSQHYKDAQESLLPYEEIETLEERETFDADPANRPAPSTSTAPETTPAPETAPGYATENPESETPAKPAPETSDEPTTESTTGQPETTPASKTDSPATKPDAKPTTKPDAPATKPDAKPTTKPDAPATKPDAKPTTKPVTPAKPTTPVKPAMPVYEPGSEGDDDPLLN